MQTLQTRWGLGLLFALAVGLRITAVALLFDPAQPPPAYEHGEIARNLLAGRGFQVCFLGQTGPTSQQAPLYPALLAACYAVFGADSPWAVLAMQGLQCLAGGVVALAVVRIAWLLLPHERSIGWWAGVWAACDPTQVYLVTHLQVAVWAALLLALTTWWALSPRITSAGRAAMLGALAAVMLLVEPIYVIVLPVLALTVWLRSPQHATLPRGALPRAVLISGLTAALVLSPWLVRNRLVHGQWVFVKSTFGYALWQGNNPASYGTDKIPKASADSLLHAHDGTLRGQHAAAWQARRENLYIDDVLLKPDGYGEFAGLSEPQRSALLGARAWSFMREQPAAYLRLCGQRLKYFLLFDETNPKAAHPVFRTATVVWLTLLGVGLCAAGPRWRALWPLAAMFVAVTLFHTLTITSVRFRLAVQPLTLAFAATAVAPPARRIAAVIARELQTSPAGALPQRAVQSPITSPSPANPVPSRSSRPPLPRDRAA